MSRLFWKFFLFLFLAQLTTVIGVSIAIWTEHRHEALLSNGLETSPPAQSNIEAAASTLQYGGIVSLKALLQDWRTRRIPQVFVVDEHGQELMQRSYSKASFDSARKLANSTKPEPYTRYIKLSDGHTFLLFVPDKINNPMNEAPPEDGVHDSNSHPGHGPPPGFPLIPLLGGSIVCFIFASLLAWYFSKPINNLRSAFQQASSGKLDVRVAYMMSGRRDELSDLGRDFDAMATRLGSLIQSQTKLLHHVSHELRSPLARMQMALGLVRQNPDKVHEFIDRVELETNRIDNLVGELLELSRLDSGVTQVQKKKFDLNQLIYSITEDAQFEATEKNIKLHLKLEQSCEYEGQPDLIYRAIENVVRNAIKFGPDGGEVNITCTYQNTDKCLHIVVCDNGTGLDELELEDIFKPFVRGLSGSQTEGHGVGLAITKQVLEAHGGKVFARNLKPKGFCVEMVLPC